MCAVGCCSEKGAFDIKKLRAFLNGYQQHKKLTFKEKQQVKVFLTYAAVSASFWRFRQYNIRYLFSELATSFEEPVSLADQVDGLSFKDLFE
jgi:Ser/Thr protein kinase RdoA (MazF antagonist)